MKSISHAQTFGPLQADLGTMPGTGDAATGFAARTSNDAPRGVLYLA